MEREAASQSTHLVIFMNMFLILTLKFGVVGISRGMRVKENQKIVSGRLNRYCFRVLWVIENDGPKNVCQFRSLLCTFISVHVGMFGLVNIHGEQEC